MIRSIEAPPARAQAIPLRPTVYCPSPRAAACVAAMETRGERAASHGEERP